ncbi:hypothetical protein GCM10007977_054040 [Dactylosporangium sucinum]|uniref:Uncharacterized protein n=1 Tax=Dactylosporangium sucinum TaxID=1424081 RepID=A0A917X028_9ACTN|nr:hypothetical protein GCM10007977_054040 [Dactylosporangium sucinum]
MPMTMSFPDDEEPESLPSPQAVISAANVSEVATMLRHRAARVRDMVAPCGVGNAAGSPDGGNARRAVGCECDEPEAPALGVPKSGREAPTVCQ